MTKDKYGQEVQIGDWICTVPKGARSVEVGKVVDFSKIGHPIYKASSKSKQANVGLTHSYDYDAHIGYKHTMVAHFTKIIPTKEIDEWYESN